LSATDGIDELEAKIAARKRAPRAPLPSKYAKNKDTADQQDGQNAAAETAGESDGDTAGVSASGNPGVVAEANGGRGEAAEVVEVVETAAAEPEDAPAEPVARVAPPRQRGPRPPAAPKVTEAMRAPRMVGRPKGPERIGLTVRILAKHDELLTEEVQRQQLSPQYIVDQALEVYFDQLKRQRAREAKSSGLKVQADRDESAEQG
jgi:hypothetical protein